MALEPGRRVVAFAAPPEPCDDQPWVAASWAFVVEPLDPGRCRFVRRYRVAMSPDLRTRAAFGGLAPRRVRVTRRRRPVTGTAPP